MPAPNKRFGEIGVKVIARTSVRPLTVSDNPNDVQLRPNFAKPPGRYRQCGESVVEWVTSRKESTIRKRRKNATM